MFKATACAWLKKARFSSLSRNDLAKSISSHYPRAKQREFFFQGTGLRKQIPDHFGCQTLSKVRRAITSVFVDRFSKFFFPLKTAFV